MFLADNPAAPGAYPVVYMNRDCDEDECGANNRRHFEINDTSDFTDLQDTKGAVLTTFFDLDENGIEDILVTTIESGIAKIKAFYNNAQSDSFHLKVLCLNGFGK